MNRTDIDPLRFCWHVIGVSRPFLLLFVLVVIYGGITEWLNAGSSDSALALILLAQMLSVSTGFTAPATRGYLDPLLVGGHSRLVVGGHLFVASALPGWIAWVSVGLVEAMFQRTLAVPAFLPAGLVSLLLVSTVAWSATLAAQRLTGGLAWLGLGILGVVTGKVYDFLAIVRMDVEGIRSNFWTSFTNGLVLPTVIPFVKWPAEILTLFVLVAVTALAAGLAFIRWKQIPLSQDL